jgi:hypothetical protein
VDLRVRVLDVLGDALGGEVLVSRAEELDDRPARRRDTPALRAQYVDRPLRNVVHRCSHSVS